MSWSEVIWELKKRGVKCNANTPYDWKIGKSSSFLDCLLEISEILEIPKEELSEMASECFANNINHSFNYSPNSTLHIGTKPEATMSKQASELAKIFDSLSVENQYKLLGTAFKLRDEKQKFYINFKEFKEYLYKSNESESK